MATTYCTCQGMRSEKTARGGRNGCRASVQSYLGSIIIENQITDANELNILIRLSDYSSSFGDYRAFSGSFDSLKKAFELIRQIERGELKVIKPKNISRGNMHE